MPQPRSSARTRSRRCATARAWSTPPAARSSPKTRSPGRPAPAPPPGVRALGEAIRSRKFAGAALDVFSAEPYAGPLLELDEVVVTPHLAASTDEAQDRAGLIVDEQAAAAADGG